MEFRSQDVAQLVLGYLKEVRCKKAFMELLYNSQYLQEQADNYRKGGFIITRVAGLSLIEYLNEYAAVYTIVQERLEASEYYRENRPPRSSLVKQILYLLDNGCIQSRTSTPIQDRPTPLNSDNIPSEVYNVQNTSGECHKSLDRISISSTPKNRLHNNSSQGSSILCKSNDKFKESVPNCDKSTSTDNEVDHKEKSHEKCEEIFTNTFLENVELIEKLADNINKEVSSKSSVELDSSAIESIVQRTETDPILVQLISELIDPENVTERDVSSEEYNKSTLDENPSNLSIPLSRKNMTSSSMIDNSVKRRLRSTTKLQSNNSEDSLIDDQNNDAVESIIAASFLSENQNLDSISCPQSELLLTTAQCHTHNPAIYTSPTDTNTVYTNTGNVLMIQPSANVANSQVLPQKSLNLDSSRPCYIIGSQPFVNVTIPPTPLKVGGVLSEQDILTMPTIFVCDNSQQYGNTQTVVVPTTAPAQTHTKTYRNIAPKPTSDKAQSISEYITLYKCSESSPYKVASPKSSFPDQEMASIRKSNMNIYQTITEEEVAADELQHTVLKTVINKEQEVENSTNKLNSETACVSSVVSSSDNVKTPPVKTTESKESTGSDVKSNSHVRQLHFSSPEKVDSSMKTERVSSKTVRTSLFKSSVPKDKDDEERTNGKIELGEKSQNKHSENSNDQEVVASWDANLRGFKSLSPVTNSSEIVAKSKRKRQEDALLQSSTSKKRKKDEDDILILEVDLNNGSVPSQVVENKPSTSGTSKNTKVTPNRTEKTSSKKSHVSERKNKKRKNPNVAASKETISDKVSDIKTADDTEKSKNEILALDKEQVMMNRVVKSRINKKCNVDNVKKLPVTDEIILTSVPKIKSCEILKEESILILSSKLNQNNETALEKENHTIVEHNVLSTCKNIVNEECRTVMNPPLTSRSLPTLETPIKNCITPIPKTPGLATSTLMETPFTKAVIDQLTGIDITSIPTPKFPITPNFAFTPAPSHSPFSNRGTDYSTSSSYYQPSDSEQNKSLEQLIQECQRLEKQENLSNVKESTMDIKKHEALKETLIQPTKVAQKNEDSTAEQKEKQIPLTENSEASIAKLFVEKRKAFNENMLGKKNMQLAKMLSDEASDENMSSSESNTSKNDSVSSSSGEDSDSSSCSCSQSPMKKSPYSLRPRKTPYKNENQDLPATKQESSKQGATTCKGEKPHTYQNEVLNKMEEIRQRTIAKFKSSNANVKQKTPTVKQKAVSKLRRRSAKNTSAESSTKPENEIADTVKSNIDRVKVTSNQLTAKSRVLRLNSDTKDSSMEAVETPKLNVQSLSDNVKEINTNIEILNAKTNDTSSNNLEAKQSDTKSDEQKCDLNKVISNNELNNVPIINLPHEKIECPVERNCVPSPEQEEDIVLHLSSDDENLQPYEMVEAELLDSSVSSTPALQYNSEDLKNSELEDDKIVDKEAELVRGLKQWGIHLIPNKLVKNSLSVVETKEKNQKQETSIRNTKDKSIKTREVLDSSLEDGEILSPVESNYPSQKKSSNLMGNISKNSNNTKRCAPKNDLKLTKKEIPALNKLSSSTSKELIKDKMNTKTDLEKKGIEQGSVTTVKPDFSIQFDTKTFETETIEISHDYNSKSCRKLSDYNFEILNKKFAANVYIEEIGEEVEKLLSFTRFNFIFELSPESYGNVNKKRPVKLKNTPIKKRSRPLNTLYKELLKNEETAHISPLENLYSSSNSSRETQYNSNKHKDKNEKVHLEHSKNIRSEENAFLKKYNKDDERSKKIRDDRVRKTIQHEKLDKLKLHSDKTQQEHKGKKEENTFEENHNLQTFSTCVKGPNKQCAIKNNEKVNDIQIESLYNSTENVETDYDDTVKNSEDYLMNYALVGSERINEDDDLSCDKRKRSSLEEQGGKVEEKKKKTEVCEELLRSIDVDSFLKQLHGDM